MCWSVTFSNQFSDLNRFQFSVFENKHVGNINEGQSLTRYKRIVKFLPYYSSHKIFALLSRWILHKGPNGHNTKRHIVNGISLIAKPWIEEPCNLFLLCPSIPNNGLWDYHRYCDKTRWTLVRLKYMITNACKTNFLAKWVFASRVESQSY